MAFKIFFSQTFLFFLFAIVLPSIWTVLHIQKKPLSNQRISIPQTNTSRYVFGICLAFFICVQFYGIYFFKLRLMADNSTDLINYASNIPFQTQLPDHLRFSYFFDKILLLPAFYLHLPMNTVGIIYCLNDALFYLIISCLILFLTGRYDYASVVLAMPVLLLGISFYFIDNMFMLGAILMVYLSVYKYLRDGHLRSMLLFLCLFFIVWSHPIVFIAVGVFFVGLYKSKEQIVKDKWLFLFLVVNLAFKFSLLDGYDKGRIKDLNGNWDWEFTFQIIVEFCTYYWYLILSLGAVYVLGWKTKKWNDYLALLVIPLMLYFCCTQLVRMYHYNFQKYIFPFSLLLLAEGIFFITNYEGRFKKLVLVFVCIVLLSGVKTNFYDLHANFVNRVRVLETLSDICSKKDPSQTKWFVKRDSLRHLGDCILSDESIVYSALNNLPNTIQLVCEVDSLSYEVYNCPYDYYYTNPHEAIPAKWLSSYYFHFKQGSYKELVVDSNMRKILGTGQLSD